MHGISFPALLLLLDGLPKYDSKAKATTSDGDFGDLANTPEFKKG